MSSDPNPRNHVETAAVGQQRPRRNRICGGRFIADAAADPPLPLPGPEPSKRKPDVRSEHDPAASSWVKAATRLPSVALA